MIGESALEITIAHAQRDPGRAADKRSRSVKLLNLPEDAQEGLLQQALEKLVPVKRLEVFGKDREAVVELEAQAVSEVIAKR